MQETSLHAALKQWYALPGDEIEVPLEGYFIDVVRGDLLIEIQTRHFSALKPKLARLIEHYPVRVVHPIAVEKWIVYLPLTGSTPVNRRRSPRRGRLEHLFSELIRIPTLIAHPNFSIEVLFTREEEVRRDDGKGSWRRKGWSIEDRRLLEVMDRVVLHQASDFAAFLPASLPPEFSSRDLAASLKIPPSLAQKAVYCLRQMLLIENVGKRGRYLTYRTCPLPA